MTWVEFAELVLIFGCFEFDFRVGFNVLRKMKQLHHIVM